jgi:hypothetical protein
MWYHIGSSDRQRGIMDRHEAVEKLIATGWRFEVWTYSPTMKGWWLRPGDPICAMRRGDPKEFYSGAIATVQLYTTTGE